MPKHPIGVLVMAYGTPRSVEQIEAYYTHIRRGQAPSPGQLADLTARYAAIGGTSPLNEITHAQASQLESALNRDHAGQFRVYLGLKHASPFIADVVTQMKSDGIEHAVSLVLAPHYSTMSVASYQKTATDMANQIGGPMLHHIDSWHLHPGFLDALAVRVKAAIAQFTGPNPVITLFSAHSLPERILAAGDPYPQQLKETGDAVAADVNLEHHLFAWQSAGRTSETWLGPDILDVIKKLAEDDWKQVLVCPAGFVSDHLEVLYDVDIECQHLAQKLGIQLIRTASLNAAADFIDALADIVRQRALPLAEGLR